MPELELGGSIVEVCCAFVVVPARLLRGRAGRDERREWLGGVCCGGWVRAYR